MPFSLVTEELATSKRSLSAIPNSLSASQLVATTRNSSPPQRKMEVSGSRIITRRRPGQHFQDFVADVVAVSVIDLFKIVDIDKK